MRARMTSFAISRAGAIAVARTNRRLRRALPTAAQIWLLLVGSVIVGIGAAITLSTGLGAGPFDVLLTGLSNRTGLPFAGALWACAGVLMLIAAGLGNRPGPGTIVAPMIIGPVVQVMLGPLAGIRPTGSLEVAHWMWLGTAQLIGVAMIGVGAGAMIVSGLGAGTGDLLAAATSSRLGRPTALIRTLLELAFLGIGLTLGGRAGVGTVLVAMTIGQSVAFGHRQVELLVAGLITPLTRLRRAVGRSVASLGADGKILEGAGRVNARFLRKTEHPLAHDVPQDLV
ncbi:MAG: hypothetical protein AAF531_04930 [Actinomycetota bacterium]